MRLRTEPDTDRKNISPLWREGGEALPFEVATSSWAADAGHSLVVEHVEIKKWPYEVACGQYHWRGEPSAKGEKINQPAVSGTPN